jgi:probable F420-dependent oxidoreductase
MKIGAVFPQTETGGDPSWVRRFGLAVEEMGFDHLVAYDHVVGAQHADRDPPLSGPYTDADPFHDPMVLFAYLAAITTKLELVTGVIILPQRQTVLVAKQAADLDLLSNERFRFGVGSGWNHVEYEALGQDFHTRGKRLDEQIEFLRKLWREPLLTYEGRFDRITRGNINPRPKRQIPLWTGGFTEPAYRRAGRLADGHLFGGTIDAIAEGWASVQRHLQENGRSVDDFGREAMLTRAGDVDETLAFLNRWRDLGGTHASVNSMGRGFKELAQHTDFLAEVRARL